MKNQAISAGVLYAALVIVGGVVIWSFVVVGGPSFNRKLAADKKRISDLRELSDEIDRYFDEQTKLPEKLTDLKKLRYRYGARRPFEDPITNKAYEFRAVDTYSYELCADFELTSQEAELEKNRSGYGNERNWDHEAGHHCFKFDIPEGKRNARSMILVPKY